MHGPMNINCMYVYSALDFTESPWPLREAIG